MHITKINKQEVSQNVHAPKKCNVFKKVGAAVGGAGYAAYDLLFEYPDVFKRHEAELAKKGISYNKGIAIKIAAITIVSGGFAVIGGAIGAGIDRLINKHRAKKAKNETPVNNEPQKLLNAPKNANVKLLNSAPAHYEINVYKEPVDEKYIISAPKTTPVLLLPEPETTTEYEVVDTVPAEEIKEWEEQTSEVDD